MLSPNLTAYVTDTHQHVMVVRAPFVMSAVLTIRIAGVHPIAQRSFQNHRGGL